MALSASALSDNAAKVGYLEKEGSSSLCSCTKPSFKLRFVVIKGQYVFKFRSPEDKNPVGRPIGLLGAKIAEKTATSFRLATIPKDYVFKASSNEELEAWIQAINQQTQLVIKQSKGHAEIPASEEQSNQLAFKQLDQRHRLAAQEAQHASFSML
eukprot:TRINITY_DN21454_c0_g1_i2.p1 TRINITY_DN21454_c0_g1~~TRINITY_DN21454_c0_g1_i2.p1  ORF type:complete len:155 (+),score=55.43 TRINITY_DN21454_c0_g1_i2:198-662(+)